MNNSLLAASVGLGLRAPHYAELLEHLPALDFLEVHSENFFHEGGAALATLKTVRQHYPVSLHGVGLSLGSVDKLRTTHLERLARLVKEIDPILVSEHLAWSALDQISLPDLLPLPATRQALDLMCERVDQVQSRLQRQILIENISAYLRFRDAEMSDMEFLAHLAERTGCGVLLDVNNLYVNAVNHGFDALAELARLPARHVGEIHLAGHEETSHSLIDTHGSAVCAEVWQLYAASLAHCAAVPTLIERDTNIPPLSDLLQEAQMARQLMAACQEAAHV